MVTVMADKSYLTKPLRWQPTQIPGTSLRQSSGAGDAPKTSRRWRTQDDNSEIRSREKAKGLQRAVKLIPEPPPAQQPVDPPVQTSHDLASIVKAPKHVKPPPRIPVPKKKNHSATWLDELRTLQQRIVDSPYFSWSVAGYVQLLLLVVLGALVLSPTKKEEPLQITVSFSSTAVEDEDEAEVIIAPPVTPLAKEPEPIEPESPEPEVLPEETVEQTEPEPSLPSAFEPSNEEVPVASTEVADKQEPSPSEAKPETSPKKPERPKPEPPKVRLPPTRAKIVGAFSAWTEPEYPSPGEPYVIVIQVTLPERITRYPSSDLSGVIMGADGFRKFIQGSKTEPLEIIEHTARIRVPVVGSERGRKDSIVIQSRILRQRQLIELNYAEPWHLGAP